MKKMTKKDYIIIANSIRRSGIIEDKNKVRQHARERMRSLIAHDLCGELKGDNPKFDADKFLEACNVQNVG